VVTSVPLFHYGGSKNALICCWYGKDRQ
jgi:hypothetical protein